MAIDEINTELALREVRLFEVQLVGSQSMYERLGGPSGQPYYNTSEWKNQERMISVSLPSIEMIAASLDDRLPERLREVEVYAWPHREKLTVVHELVGILENASKIAAIFQPKGPQLAAKDLHPWIWNAAVDLWSSGYHREAVQAAATALFDSHVPTKLGVPRDATGGKDLMAQAFNLADPTTSQPRLRFEAYDKVTNPKDWTSAHEGSMYLGMGAAQQVRNLVTHSTSKLPEQEALEMLATLSHVARLVDRATVARPPSVG